MISNTGYMQTVVPVLASLDISETVEFYTRLSFACRYQAPGEYAILQRDAIEIHFWFCTDPEIPKVTACRVGVSEIDALYAAFRPLSIVHPNAPLHGTPWHTREFGILDDHGNLITFFEPVKR